MNRIPRTVVAAALSAVLLAAAVPAAQARTLDRHQAVQPAAGWFDAALAWLGDLLVGPAQQGRQSPATKAFVSGPIGGGGGAVPMTGVCIDPWGHSAPCAGGTGGGGI
ncbi:MAG TPA: hypothetical protein VGH73_13835 [Thermoanaerobaculia bacterium]|jgi:hypothetical protein